jgi:predicted amidohydrolase YtcJ
MIALATVTSTIACGRRGGAVSPPVAITAGEPREGATGFSFVVANARLDSEAVASGVDAVAVRGTKIVAIGRSRDLEAACTAACSVIDARGGFLVPGFHDAHAHLARAGENEYQLSVRGASVLRIQATLREYAAQHRGGWILGHGWNAAAFARWPTRFDLDAVESSRPVVLRDHSGHNLWTNTAAIDAAGITRDTPDPFSGRIVRDAKGDPTGVFLDAALRLVTSKEPATTEEERERFALAGQAMSLKAACTSMQGGPVTLEEARTYGRLDRQGNLRERAFLWAPLLSSDAAFQVWVDFARALPPDGKVQIVAFKGFADGTLSASTAALLAPYSDDASNEGRLYLRQDILNQAVVRANRAGFPAAIHAIGDRAVRAALDAFEVSRNALGHRLVNRVEHALLVDPSDAKRFGSLGVAASVQPVWLYGYPSRASFLPDRRLGEARVPHVYPWNELAGGGGLLLFGSDVPSSDLLDPLTGIFSAVLRRFPSGDDFVPAQRIDEELALRAYTTNPAVAIGWGDRIGKIAVGYEADLVLLDHDPRDGARSLGDDPMRRMWIGGQPVEP